MVSPPPGSGSTTPKCVASGPGAGDKGPVAVDCRIDGHAHRGQEGVPAARAVADDADLAVGRGEGAEFLDGRLGVAYELVVGDAARLPGGGRGVVGIHIESLAGVEVGADGVV